MCSFYTPARRPADAGTGTGRLVDGQAEMQGIIKDPPTPLIPPPASPSPVTRRRWGRGRQIGPGEETPAGGLDAARGAAEGAPAVHINGGSIFADTTGLEIDAVSLPRPGRPGSSTQPPLPTPLAAFARIPCVSQRSCLACSPRLLSPQHLPVSHLSIDLTYPSCSSILARQSRPFSFLPLSSSPLHAFLLSTCLPPPPPLSLQPSSLQDRCRQASAS
jgi:hypothetical protein